VKKALLTGAVLLAGLVVFGASTVIGVNSGGGLAAESGVAKMPLLGGMFKVKEPAEPEGAEEPETEPAELPAGRGVPFLRFGPEVRLQKLAQELGVKKAEYDNMLHGLERRERELEAWERQIKTERDDLRDSFRLQKEDLALLREQLARKQTELDALQVAIVDAEEQNLKKTAAIYGKMESEKAAEILAQMYSDGEQETVVKIIYLMQDRTAAKALAAFTDPKMSAEITEQLKRIRKSQQKGGQG